MAKGEDNAIAEQVIAPAYHTSAEISLPTRSAYARQRVFECVPAGLLLATLTTPVILLAVSPRLAYLVLCGYVVYWALRSIGMAIRQANEFFRMRRYKRIDWHARLAHLTDPFDRLAVLAGRTTLGHDDIEEREALLAWVHADANVPSPDELHHLIVLPVANESAEIVVQTLDALADADYDSDKLLICLSFEGRSVAWSADKIAEVTGPYLGRFGMLLTTQHPDALLGEARVKGANTTWAARTARVELRKRGIPDEHVVVSAFDCDTRPSPHYFQVLSYTHLTNPGRDRDSYQPILLFHNNVWHVPAPSRLVGYIASMWTMVDSTQPARLRLFSSHAMGLRALVDVGFWSTNVIPDDSRQYWRMYFSSDGRAVTRPLHTAVYLDSVHADGYLASLREQYRQIRRWAYGVIDFPYVMRHNLTNGRIPVGVKVVQTYRQLSQFHQWAMTPIMVMVARWLIGLLAPGVQTPHFIYGRGQIHLGPGFGLVDLAGWMYALTPVITLGSMLVGVVVALALLPHRPADRSGWAYARLAAEWLLLPIVVPIFFCFPAIDAQIRLAARRYLGFQVTVKSRFGQGHQLR